MARQYSLPDLINYQKLNPASSLRKIVDIIGADYLNTQGAKYLFITGDNASGKSVVRKILQTCCNGRKIECLDFSQEGRLLQDNDKVMIYQGEERNTSTGNISCNSVVNSLNKSATMRKPHVIIFDEPEIGLGEEARLGLAQYIKFKLENDWPDFLLGVIFITHERKFVEEFKDLKDFKFFNINKKYPTAEDWLARKIEPISPEQIRALGDARFKELLPFLNMG